MGRKLVFIFLSLLLLLPALATAQVPEPSAVLITASDGLEIHGDYYVPAGDSYPAVVLLHMLNGSRREWQPLIPVLLEQGFAVLAVDLRGHAATGGSRDWALAETDVQTMIDWLREQAGVSQIAIAGGSIGSNLAIRGAANDETIVSAVALSPGLDYRGVMTEDAVETYGDRPLLLLASKSDSYSALSVTMLFELASGDKSMRVYTGGRHGTVLLPNNEPLLHLIANWLAEQFAAASS